MAEVLDRRLSTTWVLAICTILLLALAADYWWQSTENHHADGIYPDATGTRLVLKTEHQPALEFERSDNGWQLTSPLKAPANPQVIDHLLASNYRASRSYPLSAIPEIADQTAIARLGIDNQWFEFKSIEPVSGLRYVVAADRIYLQPDRVVPLIQAGVQMAIDRKIAEVCGSKANECDPVALAASHLVAHESGDASAGEIDLKLASGKTESYTLYNEGDLHALHRVGTTFRYVLAADTAALLGLPATSPLTTTDARASRSRDHPAGN